MYIYTYVCVCICVFIYRQISQNFKGHKTSNIFIFLQNTIICHNRHHHHHHLIWVFFLFLSSYHMIYIYECMSLCVSWTVESEKRYSKDKKDKRKNDWFILMYVVKKKTKKDTPFLTIYRVSSHIQAIR